MPSDPRINITVTTGDARKPRPIPEQVFGMLAQLCTVLAEALSVHDDDPHRHDLGWLVERAVARLQREQLAVMIRRGPGSRDVMLVLDGAPVHVLDLDLHYPDGRQIYDDPVVREHLAASSPAPVVPHAIVATIAGVHPIKARYAALACVHGTSYVGVAEVESVQNPPTMIEDSTADQGRTVLVIHINGHSVPAG